MSSNITRDIKMTDDELKEYVKELWRIGMSSLTAAAILKNKAVTPEQFERVVLGKTKNDEI